VEALEPPSSVDLAAVRSVVTICVFFRDVGSFSVAILELEDFGSYKVLVFSPFAFGRVGVRFVVSGILFLFG